MCHCALHSNSFSDSDEFRRRVDVCVCIVDTSTTTHTFTLDLSTLEREREQKNKMGECCTKGYAENKRGSRELDRGGDLFYIKISKRRAFVWTSSHMSKENIQRPVISPPSLSLWAGLPSLLYSKCAMGHADVCVFFVAI
jgi:hypothetical protein